MVDIFQGIVIAIIQGIVEWLPISSEGQLSLVLVNILGLSELEAVTLALLLHLGTMISVIAYFRSDLLGLRYFRSRLLQVIVVATLGTAVTAIPLIMFFKSYWETIASNLPLSADILFTVLIGVLLILTGVILSKQPEQGIRTLESLTAREALLLGMAQGIAALPGISRSGMTVTILLVFGLTQSETFRTSFIISIPAVLGATGLEFILGGFTVQSGNIAVGQVILPIELILGIIAITAVIGFLSIETLLRFRNVRYDKFCVVFGIGTILLAVLLLLIGLL
ncbi:MAG: undecaprenyl-diphosphate phosphatase [Candidatus Heimdallarchaeota archaeon]